MMENGGDVTRKRIRAEDVISKLKDDGDFDRLRLKIIRRLKENQDLRDCITSMVKQSDALNRPGAENMKPRQLSDAIHQEVGDKALSQVSDSLWEIIRSPDGMKSEIRETVQSVYNRLLNPRRNEEGASSLLNSLVPVQKQADNSMQQTFPPHERDNMPDDEPEEPPGFSLSNHHQNNHVELSKELQLPNDRRPIEEKGSELCHSKAVLESDYEGIRPPGFPAKNESKLPCDGSDDDPDVPPGFG